MYLSYSLHKGAVWLLGLQLATLTVGSHRQVRTLVQASNCCISARTRGFGLFPSKFIKCAKMHSSSLSVAETWTDNLEVFNFCYQL